VCQIENCQLSIGLLDHSGHLVYTTCLAKSSKILPGLIEGAREQAKLGCEFLRHIEGTRITVHILNKRKSYGSGFTASRL
jgi:GTPase involved in cell partitioning and DNA repair